MATVEERLASLEHEHTELKKALELHTIAIGALVNKATLEKLNEKYDKLFDALTTHDRLTNEQLAEFREQQTQLDGKIVGLQTEMRQRFDAVNARFETVATKDDLSAMNARFETMDTRFDQIMAALATLSAKPDQQA